MLFQDFQTTSRHHEFPRWSNHPPCNRSVPPDQKIREGKHLPVPFQYLVSLSHDLLRGPRKHRIRNAEGRWQLPFCQRFAWFVCWLECRGPQVWLSPGVPQEAQAAPWLGGHREGHTLSRRAPHCLPVPGLPLGTGMTPYNRPTTRGEALMKEVRHWLKSKGDIFTCFLNNEWIMRHNSLNWIATKHLCVFHTQLVFFKDESFHWTFLCSFSLFLLEFVSVKGIYLVYSLVCVYSFLLPLFLFYLLWCV